MILKYFFPNTYYLQPFFSSNGKRILKKSKSLQKYFGFRIGSVLFVHPVEYITFVKRNIVSLLYASLFDAPIDCNS